jgi:rhodanese-related sulfurtransferase
MKSLSKGFIILVLLIYSQLIWAYTNLTPSEVHDRLISGDSVLVLDVREVDEYKTGHMAEPPGNLPLTPMNMGLNSGVLEENFNLLPRDIDIIVYCRSGGRSATASAFLENQGFSRIYNMTNGFSSWTYESRTGGYGDHSGSWIRIEDPSPVTLLFENKGDTSKVVFSTSAIPAGMDSVYFELHLAPVTAYIPPQYPTTDVENVYRMIILDRFGLELFDADSLNLLDSVSVYLSLSTEVESVLNPSMYIYVPGSGWPIFSAQFDAMVFSYNDSVLRKWYYLGADFDPTVVGNFNISDLPEKFALHQNYPNPFNPKTYINYELPITNYVEISIYNCLGQRVVTIVSEEQSVGHHQVEWETSGIAGGVYYYTMKASDFHDVKKMVLIK